MSWPCDFLDSLDLPSLILIRECLFTKELSTNPLNELRSWKLAVETAAYDQARVNLLNLSRSTEIDSLNLVTQDEALQLINMRIVRKLQFSERKATLPVLIGQAARQLPVWLRKQLNVQQQVEVAQERELTYVPPSRRNDANTSVNDTLRELLASEPDFKVTRETPGTWEEKVDSLTYTEAQAIMADKSEGTLKWLYEKTEQTAKADPIRSRTQALFMCAIVDALEALWALHRDQRAETDSMFVYDQVEGRCGASGLDLLIDCLNHTEKLNTQLTVYKRFLRGVQPTPANLGKVTPCPTCIEKKNVVPSGLSASYVKHIDDHRNRDKITSNSALQTAVLDSPNYPILATLGLLEYNTIKTSATEGGAGALGKKEPTLPEGTIVRDEDMYKAFILPAKISEPLSQDDLMPVSSMADWARNVFYGIERLNQMQTKVYPTVYETDENILVCAPTGAGKTNIALLAILQCLRPYIEIEGKAPLANEFKIVYVAPLKSLVTEISNKFSDRLGCIGLKVGEFTGDTPLTKAELDKIHVIVTVPEKWDIQTRNSKESSLALLKLMIIDEVHLVGETRGGVLEAVVARSYSYMAEAQQRHRVLALSATLPNVQDVALFLEVKKENCFVFDDSYRPIPLQQTLIGLKCNEKQLQSAYLSHVWAAAEPTLRKGRQCMVFVHSRNDTIKTAEWILEESQMKNLTKELLACRLSGAGNTNISAAAGKSTAAAYSAQKRLRACQHEKLKSLLINGIGVHHAGLSRADRRLVETLFHDGFLTVLCTTATLAWGVNLPAHQVIIKGTQIMEAQGVKKDLGILDVLQIFGRAGRPDFFDSGQDGKKACIGEAVLLTENTKLDMYLKQLLRQTPLESSLEASITDHLNAEIVLGNISDLRGAAQWLRHTFLFVRMRRNPSHYGIQMHQLNRDSTLYEARILLAQKATTLLHQAHLIRKIGIDQSQITLSASGLGRVAAKYYISYQTISMFNKALDDPKFIADPSVGNILLVVSGANEFEKLRVRDDDELDELVQYRNRVNHLLGKSSAVSRKPGELSPTTQQGTTLATDDMKVKVSLLVLMWLEDRPPRSFSLQSDTNYIIQSYGRLMRGFAEVCLLRRMGVSQAALKILELSKAMHTRVLPRDAGSMVTGNLRENIIAHFCKSNTGRVQNPPIAMSVVQRLAQYDFQDTLEMTVGELVHHTKSPADGRTAFELIRKIPNLVTSVQILPITFSILRVSMTILPLFEWSDKYLGRMQKFNVIFEDLTNILHHQEFILRSENVKIIPKSKIPGRTRETEPIGPRVWRDYGITCEFQIPLISRKYDSNSSTFILHLVSDQFVDVAFYNVINLSNLMFPTYQQIYTKLQSLNPLPVKILKNRDYESLYKFTHFNPIQTQVFYTLYHTNDNVLIGAPTGSGKTICAEFALFRLFDEQRSSLRQKSAQPKCVYIGPLKSLVKERLKDWALRFGGIGKRIVELSGDITPDLNDLKRSDLILTTPEKWDGITRFWQSRDYVKSVKLMIIDEIHLLGSDRGSILEMIVSRTRFINKSTGESTRIIGLSTALANAVDIAKWLGVDRKALYNFRPSVRPVPCTVYVSGFSEPAYCKRMATMDKPVFNAILEHSPKKPVLVFVSSRRQVRRTGKELVFMCKTNDLANAEGVLSAVRFLNVPPDDLGMFERRIDDTAEDGDLRECLKGGVALHHAGLSVSDRRLSEELFSSGQVQILVATSTLAWGVNLPAHLVVVKGTEYYDAISKRYVDFPITDLLQMIGRAGRPQYDSEAHACVMALEDKKNFYRRFLYEAFPVESSLHTNLASHLNAFVVDGSVKSKKDAFTLISCTYLFRRLIGNISYYDERADDHSQSSQSESIFSSSPQTAANLLRRRIVHYLDLLISNNLVALQKSGCITVTVDTDDNDDLIDRVDREANSQIKVAPTELGRIASSYYISHTTVARFAEAMKKHDVARNLDTHKAMRLLCSCLEFSYVPVRHSEDEHNDCWNQSTLPLPLDTAKLNTGNEKAMALFQMHMWSLRPPVHDYYIDCKSLLAAGVRLIMALADVIYYVSGSYNSLSHMLKLYQNLTQGTNPLRCDLYTLPHVTKTKHIQALANLKTRNNQPITSTAQLLYADHMAVRSALMKSGFIREQWNNFETIVGVLPRLVVTTLSLSFLGDGDKGEGGGEGGGDGPCRWLPCEGEFPNFQVSAGQRIRVSAVCQQKRGWIDNPFAGANLKDSYVYAPKWPRERNLSFWCMLAEYEDDVLIHFKRCNSLEGELQFEFDVPTDVVIDQKKRLVLRIAPDCYVGLDKIIEFDLWIK